MGRLLSRGLLGRRRRVLAAVLAALAMACAAIGLRPDTSSVTVLAAARDLPGGVLTAADAVPVALRPGTAPDGALRPGTPVAGRMLAGPMRRGEPFTDVRMLGPDLLATHRPGTVATPVRVADPDSARLLSPGDTVNVLASPADWDGSEPARSIAEGVTVLALPADESGRGALIVLATTPGQAAELASAQSGGRLSITMDALRR
ncbi:RcpC/CpaB family pilus assembly protein [Planobispora siamensis]|uniref:RcpC/CpaB family pilus assembly protein n=1 Tax=Planobispora siamensis TaxID=936338 RepID=UPI0019508E42|nr:RcpC/CpaB family pilus assembly protein [Planobispora siamensis]